MLLVLVPVPESEKHFPPVGRDPVWAVVEQQVQQTVWDLSCLGLGLWGGIKKCWHGVARQCIRRCVKDTWYMPCHHVNLVISCDEMQAPEEVH